MKRTLQFLLFCVFTNCYSQRFFTVDEIKYKILVEADESSTYGTVSVVKPDKGMEYEGDVVIPNVVKESDDKYSDTYKVVAIDEEAFARTEDLHTVSIPASIESIGYRAFYNSSLERIIIPVGNLKEIGEATFCGSRLKSITLPTTIKKIGDSAFSGCYELKNVECSGKIEEVGEYAFYKCKKLEKVMFKKSIRLIGDNAFEQCLSLCEIVTGGDLKSIGSAAFRRCMHLRHMDFPFGLKYIGPSAFAHSSLTEISLPNTLKKINDRTFYFSQIRTANIPEGISIGNEAFAYCKIENTSSFSGVNIAEDAFVGQDYIGYVDWGERYKYDNTRINEIINKHAKSNNRICVDYSNLNIGDGFKYEINEVNYDIVSIPKKDGEYGVLHIWSIDNAMHPKGGDSNTWETKKDIVLPDIVEIVNGPFEEKYVVDNLKIKVIGPNDSPVINPNDSPVLDIKPESILKKPEELASFIEGDIEKWIDQNINRESIKPGLKPREDCRLWVKFVINKDGNTSDFEILYSPNEYLSKEAERLVKMMKWKPARQHGQPVRSYYEYTFSFCKYK